MSYCIKCGKEIEDGRKYCDEHSESLNSQQIMPNVSFVTGENQQEPTFSVDKSGTVAAQFGTPVHSGPFVPAKKAPLWFFALGAFVASLATGLLNLIFTGIRNILFDSLYLEGYGFFSNILYGNIISVIVFAVISFGVVILYNKNCKKNSLENSVFPVWYAGVFYVCRQVSSIVGSLLSGLAWIVLGIVNEVTYVGFDWYDASPFISAVEGVVDGIAFIVVTFFVFSFIHKKQIKK